MRFTTSEGQKSRVVKVVNISSGGPLTNPVNPCYPSPMNIFQSKSPVQSGVPAFVLSLLAALVISAVLLIALLIAPLASR